jgi:hypothetical protein
MEQCAPCFHAGTQREQKYSRSDLTFARGYRGARWNSGHAFYRLSGAYSDYIDATQARAARDGRRKHADKAIRFFHKE